VKYAKAIAYDCVDNINSMVSRLTESLRRNLNLPVEGEEIREEKPTELFSYLMAASVPNKIERPTTRRPSELINHWRQAMLSQHEDWEYTCRACYARNILKIHPTQVEAQDTCHKCGTTLLLTASADEGAWVKPVRVMKQSLSERLRQARERAAFRQASDQQNQEQPFWMIRPSKLE
jgi:hypothetical protein